MKFIDLFRRRKDSSAIFDLDLMEDQANSAYLKTIALQVVINFVARSISQSNFRVYDGDELQDDSPIAYKLNVRPNPNQSASNFWRSLIYKLLKNNEVLVIQSDSGDLFCADQWNADDMVLYPTRFSRVTVTNDRGNTYVFDRIFSMDEVWYLNYSNEKLTRYINALGNDIADLYTRTLEAQKRNGQIRGIIDVGVSSSFKDKRTQALQTYIDKIYKSFKTSSVAVIPQTDGFKYEELSGKQGIQKQSVSDLKALQNQVIDSVANLIGVPPALIYGQNERLDSNIESYLKFCLNPLIKMLQDELNAKIFEPEAYQRGKHIQIVGLNKRDIYESAQSIDKLISGGVLNPNTVLHDFGYKPRVGGDEYLITKNYTTLKGGEIQDDEDNN